MTRSFFTFWKNVKMYSSENARIDEEMAFFKKVLNFFFNEREEVSILFDGIDVKVDKVRIRGQRQDDKYFEDIYDLFLSLCMSGVVFKRGVTDGEILDFYRVVGKYPVGREPKVQVFERIRSEMPPMPHIEIFPYDPEESGNLPIYTPEQSFRRIYRKMVADYREYERMAGAGESIPFRAMERSIQDTISIAQNAGGTELYDFILFLASSVVHGGDFAGTAAMNRAVLAVLICLRLDFDAAFTKRTAIAAYLQYIAQDLDRGYAILSRMDEFNYGRVEAALNSSSRITDFSDVGLLLATASCGTVSAEILKVVSYYDTVTRRWPERYAYSGPTLSRPDALHSLLRNIRMGAFKKELVEALIATVGVYPPGSILKLSATNELAVSGGRFESYGGRSAVFVLNADLSVKAKRGAQADELVDLPESAGRTLPARTLIQILSTYLNDTVAA
jgi:hypothetical protein